MFFSISRQLKKKEQKSQGKTTKGAQKIIKLTDKETFKQNTKGTLKRQVRFFFKKWMGSV